MSPYLAYVALCLLVLAGIAWSGWRRWWHDEFASLADEKRRLRALAPRSVPGGRR